MNVNQEVRLNLSADGIPPRLFMPQGDANSRTIIATLWDGAAPYNVPASAAVMVRFRKPDGTGGLYDATEAGTAVTASGNTVTAPVATQMLAVAGVVQAEIDIYGTGSGKAADRLATFRFAVEVAPSVYPDAQIISSDYFNLIAATISKAIEAAAKADLAKTAAQAAQSAAETAQSGAESAEQGAQAAQAAAENAKTAAQTAQQGAKAAQDAAEDAQAAAEGAKSGAQTAQQGAEAAQQGAQTAQQGAEAAQQGAEAAQQGAEAAQDAAEDAQAAAASSAAAAAASAANAATSVEGAVKYNTPQALTDAQKQQARDNINAPAPYEAGDNIAITGGIITTKAFPCNPNLLDNWYFGNPVNQRGQTSYTGSRYMIDRWYAADVALAISSGDIRVSRSSSGQRDSRIMQNLETELSKEIAGKTCTLSALVKSVSGIGQVRMVLFNISDDTASTTDIYASLTGGIDLITLTFVVPESYSGKSLGVFFYPDSDDHSRSNGCDVYAIKLELGSQQTLAHQENGAWVLNEMPKFGDQLAVCRWYCRVYKSGEVLPCLAYGQSNGWYASAVLPFDLRATPANNIAGGLACVLSTIDGGDGIISNIVNWGITSSVQFLKIDSVQQNALKENAQYSIKLSNDLILSADL